MKKKVLAAALVFALSTSICGNISAAEATLRIGDNTVTVNGEEQTTDTAPVIINDRTLVPLRLISEIFGSSVDWDAKTKTIHIADQDKKSSEATEKNIDANTFLSLWTDGAEAKEKLVSYMKTITDKSSADYIPIENRIAVFDLDGTLFCETDPNYFDYTLLVHRVLEDESYIDKASDFEKE
ncbi:MAG: copper amine oxidase N-terminal domain-containing protein, partial [Firmicutes bacterium]|nr:copper amine oxidase N-terminal domain-containing protein [Bacillota bacterium]